MDNKDIIKLCEEYKEKNKLNEQELLALEVLISILKLDDLTRKENK